MTISKTTRMLICLDRGEDSQPLPLLLIRGRLQGSRALRLEAELYNLQEEGNDRVIIDLRECESMDSCGAEALRSGMVRGLELYLVFNPMTQFPHVLPCDHPIRWSTRIYRSVEEAILAAAGSTSELTI